jgi:hypothetical protein
VPVPPQQKSAEIHPATSLHFRRHEDARTSNLLDTLCGCVSNVRSEGHAQGAHDRVICWLTGYEESGLLHQIRQKVDFEAFFAQAPAMHPNSSLIKGVVCGVRVEEVEDPLMQKIRQLDKLVDELAKGKAMEKVLRP